MSLIQLHDRVDTLNLEKYNNGLDNPEVLSPKQKRQQLREQYRLEKFRPTDKSRHQEGIDMEYQLYLAIKHLPFERIYKRNRLQIEYYIHEYGVDFITEHFIIEATNPRHHTHMPDAVMNDKIDGIEEASRQYPKKIKVLLISYKSCYSKRIAQRLHNLHINVMTTGFIHSKWGCGSWEGAPTKSGFGGQYNEGVSIVIETKLRDLLHPQNPLQYLIDIIKEKLGKHHTDKNGLNIIDNYLRNSKDVQDKLSRRRKRQIQYNKKKFTNKLLSGKYDHSNQRLVEMAEEAIDKVRYKQQLVKETEKSVCLETPQLMPKGDFSVLSEDCSQETDRFSLPSDFEEIEYTVY